MNTKQNTQQNPNRVLPVMTAGAYFKHKEVIEAWLKGDDGEEDADDESLGGAEMHARTSGLADYLALKDEVEIVRGEAGARQVEGARIALAENGGGLHGIEEAVATVTLLGR